MLSRAAARALPRGTAVSARLQLATCPLTRSYARDSKPSKKWASAYQAPPSARAMNKRQHRGDAATEASSVGGYSYSSSKKVDPSDNPENSKEQVEVDAEADAARNTIPQSRSSHPDNSRSQDEFGTGSAYETNTAPQSSSPSAVNPGAAQEAQEQPPSQPLPDLTQGIPSTLDAEIAAASKASSKPESTNLNLTEDPSSASTGGGKDGGDLPKSAYVSSADRRRDRFANYSYAAFALFAATSVLFLGRNWETPEEEAAHEDAPSGWAFGLFYNRAKARLGDMLNYYNEPAFPKLLPNPDPAWERPYTLVLSLEDLLVHSEWTREHGWRMAKRPGVDYFLRYLSQYYELVIFTSVPSMVADPVIRKLDPYRIVMWPLFREATKYKNGEYIKDLSYLNRDLSKVLLIDTEAGHARLQPENAIILPKWTGQPQDKELVSLIPFLEYLATMGFDDTRKVLESFKDAHIPTEFARREAIARENFEKQMAEERAKRPKRSMGGLVGSLLGIKPPGAGIDGMEQTPAEAFEQGKMLQDQIRERGQKQYEILEREIRENGEKWLKEMAAEEEKAKEEQMKGVKQTFAGVFGGPPPPQQQQQ
ncbi:MAG: hypothetical protein M1819_007085 [Sarea resinae]|nr:MAG: hypothetical protein M1819_007085 [Sarea resinae]